MGRETIAVGLCALVALTPSACSEDKKDVLDDCRSLEDRAYPAVRDIATRTLDGLTYTSERLRYCEETGEPQAVEVALLPDYPTRRSVMRLLVERGWTRFDSSLISPDGHHRAIVTAVGGEVAPARDIQVTFSDFE